jgi:hypothetical protein
VVATAEAPSGIFLLGAARSGTSLLYKALCLHPDVTYISNWHRRAPRAPWLGILNRIPRRWPTLQREAWFAGSSEGYVYGTRRRLAQRLAPQPVEGEPIFAQCGFRQFDWEPEMPATVRAERLSGTFDLLRKSAGASTVVSKRIANNRRAADLHQALPDARFVALVRDGRAVAQSLALVDWWPEDVLWWDPEGRTPRQLEASGADPWELCARNWVEDTASVERGLTDVPEEQVLWLRYEDLVGNSVNTLRSIAEFAGLPLGPSWLERIAGLQTPNRNDAWRTLPPAVIGQIEDVQKEALTRYGYLA